MQQQRPIDPRVEVLPPGPPASKPNRGGWATALSALGIFALKSKTVLSMGLSIWLYSFAWGWTFAIGIVLLILVHELGHVAAARLMGIPVTAPLFIPFFGAGVAARQDHRDAWSAALMAYGGPLAGTLVGVVVWWVALQSGTPWLMALARANFALNLFNMIPLPPLDGGQICAAVSPWFWIVGLLLYGYALITFHVSGPFLIVPLLILAMALPRLMATLFQPSTPEMQAYYNTHISNRLTMSMLYLSLIAGLLLGYWDANDHLQAFTAR